jgi:hypothetical protein
MRVGQVVDLLNRLNEQLGEPDHPPGTPLYCPECDGPTKSLMVRTQHCNKCGDSWPDNCYATVPGDATVISHHWLIRMGFVRSSDDGLYSHFDLETEIDLGFTTLTRRDVMNMLSGEEGK